MIDAFPRQLLVDAGPVVGAMDARDEHHEVSVLGFRGLHAARTRLILPLPIVYEAYKRIAYDSDATSARRALDFMLDGFELVLTADTDLTSLRRLLDSMPRWDGSLEDATLAWIGLCRDVPVWTFNYRDLRHFPNLQFWNPA